MGTFIGCYENVRARVISLSAVTMLTTFFADPASAHRPDIRRCNTRQARGAHSAGILEPARAPCAAPPACDRAGFPLAFRRTLAARPQ